MGRLLFNWKSVLSLYADKMSTFPLQDKHKQLVHVYSVLFKIAHLIRVSQGTSTVNIVQCVWMLLSVLQTALNPTAPLQLFNPPEATETDYTLPKAYTKKEAQLAEIDPLAQDLRERLRVHVEEKLMHVYALMKKKAERDWTLDMAMFLFPPQACSCSPPDAMRREHIVVQACMRMLCIPLTPPCLVWQATKMKHISILLKLYHHDQRKHGDKWTKAEIKEATEQRIKKLMHQAIRGERQRREELIKERAATDSASSSRPKSQSQLRGLAASGVQVADVEMSDDESSRDSSGGVQSDDFLVDAEFTAFKKLASTTYDPALAKDPSSKATEPVGQDRVMVWWEHNKTALPWLYQVAQHVYGHVMSSGQLERDFGACSLVLRPIRGALDPRYFQAQSLSLVNLDELPEPEEMPKMAMTNDEVERDLPKAGFGVPQIYERAHRLDVQEEETYPSDDEEEVPDEDPLMPKQYGCPHSAACPKSLTYTEMAQHIATVHREAPPCAPNPLWD